MSRSVVVPPIARARKIRAWPFPSIIVALIAAAVPVRAQDPPITEPAGGETDPWTPEPTELAREALEQLEEGRRALGIVAESAGTAQPCARAEGPNLVNFIRRGEKPGDPTYLFGIDLCTRRPFVYREPTRSGVIVGFDANPPDIQWAEDPSDDRNLRGDRFDVELLAGMEVLFGTSTLDFGDNADGTVDVAAAPSLGVRFDRFRVMMSRAVLPLEQSWLAKVSVMPFRKGPRETPAQVREPPPGSGAARTTWFDPVDDPCNASGVGVRGVDHFRMGHRNDDGRYPVSLDMVSYCTRPYRMYRVRTFTDQTWFGQFNNTFPKFAAWDDLPRGGLLNNLAFTVGYGEVLNDVFNVDFPTDVVYLGLGFSFGDSRWRVDFGRLITNEELRVISAGVPVTITSDGWTVQVQRALHLAFLGS